MKSTNTIDSKSSKSRLQKLLGRFAFRRQSSPKPYIPHPGQVMPDPVAGINAEFTDTEMHVNHIHGTTIIFGTKNIAQTDENGNTTDISQQPSYRIGSNKIINAVDQVAGICSFCEANAFEQFQAGLISIQQAQLRSMYDHASAAQCSLCNRNACKIHCPSVNIEGQIQNLCVNCLDNIEKKNKRQRIICFLLAPFLESDCPE
jgi:hypothetical protein